MINIMVKLLKLLNLKNSPQNTNTNETLEIVSLTSESFEDIQNEFIKIMDVILYSSISFMVINFQLIGNVIF